MATFVSTGRFNSNDGGTTIPISAQNHTSGNLLVVTFRWEGGDTTISCSDTAGNTYTALGSSNQQCGTSGAYIRSFYCLNITGDASNAITATLGASRSYRDGVVVEYSGVDSYVSHEYADGGNASSVAGGGLSASTDGLLVGHCGTFNFKTISVANSLDTLRQYTGGNALAGTGDHIFTGSGTKTSGFSWTGNSNCAVMGVLFADPSSGITKSIPNGTLSLTAGTPKQTMLQIHKVPAHGT